jgi:hypothetical protein
MAKSTKRPPRDKERKPRATVGTANTRPASAAAAGSDTPNPRADETLVDLAEDLGRLLGTAERRMGTWLGERQELATKLVQIRDTANQYLRDLTAGGASLAAAIDRGRRSAPKTSPSNEDSAGTESNPTQRKRRKV